MLPRLSVALRKERFSRRIISLSESSPSYSRLSENISQSKSSVIHGWDIFLCVGQGIRRDVHPTSLKKIFLEFILNSKDANEKDMQKAIKLSEETYCPVWAMLKGNVEIVTQYRILNGKS